jgi:hypothetical protein
MDRCQGPKRRTAGRQALPTDDQAAILLLEPGQRPLRLEPGHRVVDGSPAGRLGFPDALRDLRTDPPPPELLPQGFRLRAFSRGQDVETCAGAPPGARSAP